jgi:hypothetical protein
MQLFCLDGNGAEVPMDIAGYQLKLDVRLYPGAPDDPLLSVSTGDGRIVVTSAATGEVEIDWPAIKVAIRALPSFTEAGDPLRPRVDTFAYDLLLIAADGDAQALAEGIIPVSYGVTAA